ncbi:glycosyltransferase [Kaistella jeonii]|uniref:Glycosyl transferase family 1 domain-containing protein n=1 Tax=Kaistella jeonii TaxID=266749 RepID=A0A0C1D5V7_9FLAO|nr:glycosyltransferase [Kaistella jeonii]KIA89115.1 hypothetical protein OA86_08620 [Kaistella jeonii]SFB93974.1 Glycosyltransferase involved in cell wall bisynthesis [Kaistella jeonii]VEI97070.1 putative glycosyl transferase [Kaistella jeonii]
MKILVVGIFLESGLIEKYNQISDENAKISVAAVKYSKMIKAGFEENLGPDIDHVFLAPIGMYPRCKTLRWNRRNIDGIQYLKFINIFFLKQLTIAFDLVLMMINWNRENKNQKKIVVFTSIYLPFLFAIIPFKIFSNIKFVSFVPDLPAHSFSYTTDGSFLKRKLIPAYIYLANKLNALVDYYVFITKYMSDIYPNKPFTIIEGFVDVKKKTVELPHKSFPKAVLYSGSLFEKFGIKNLLTAFTQIEGDYELWLFGGGDMTADIIDYATKDKRIKYFGNRPNTEILNYQKKATLLINPRFSHEEFTKYSFPSKLMEYLSSGTAILTTRLLGIPDDYQDKFYFIEDESVSGFKQSIENCLKKNTDELETFGNNGKNFVMNNKNYISQIKKLIIDLKDFFKIND